MNGFEKIAEIGINIFGIILVIVFFAGLILGFLDREGWLIK